MTIKLLAIREICNCIWNGKENKDSERQLLFFIFVFFLFFFFFENSFIIYTGALLGKQVFPLKNQ